MTGTIDLGATADQTGVIDRPDVNVGNLGVFGTIGVNTNAVGVVGATGAMRFDLAGMNTCTLTNATPCTLSFTAPTKSNSKAYLKIAQPAAGATTTVVFPGSIIGTPPQPTATLGAITFYEFDYDGTNYYFVYSNVSSGGGGVAIGIIRAAAMLGAF